ncbi:TraO conjugal transfer like protein [Candidatus Glomeribacter gigasporarum BEG34]|uniref:TraO conjugal transfer like protein n=1 Tax=Candidatus Glomeribacter gigasporarum BEG34 TaxID=1070319 RepID=G2J847_9BURK|nr:DotG/IcmE/VirB10 family protein [Candidatus Glomeribacter gigasporarum]CCD28944.1 TraO conjugal transfer like protein [Candidatus Glomeribacter gigasporarum BEG34]
MSKMRAGFSRQIKVIVIMALLAVTGAILSVFWLTRRHAANAHVEVPGIDAQGGVSSPETPYYAQTLQSVNRQKLAQAQRTQGSFVPALSERTGSKPPDLELKPLEQSLEQRAQPVDDGAQTDAQLRTLPPLPAPSPGVDKQVEALVAAWDHPPQSQKILGIQTLESTAERENAPPAAHGPAGRSTTSALASTDLQPLIHATDQYGAHLENAIDTDAPSEVFAVLDQGPCKGAQLIGSSQLTHEALSVTFTAMHCKDKTYAIQAMALNDQTLGRALPADVDHRYGQRIVTPAILGALGAAGAVYGNAGKTILHSPLGGYTEQTDANPSIRQIGGAAAAAGLSGVQNALAQQAASIPPIRARVRAGTAILVKFKADVIPDKS